MLHFPSEGGTGSGQPWGLSATPMMGTGCSNLSEEPHRDQALIPQKAMLPF